MATERSLLIPSRSKALDAAGNVLGRAVSALLGRTGPGVRNALHGVWLGHPLHPVLTDIPLGAWTAGVTLDWLHAAGAGRHFARGADAAVTIGLAGAVGAAVTGAADWQHTDGEARRIGVLHGLLNIAATSLFVASLVERKRNRRPSARALGLAGFAIGGLSAYLGGHLVYRHRIGVNHGQDPEPSAEFQPVLESGEVPANGMRRVKVGVTSVLLARCDGRVHAIGEVCTHLGGPLAEGQVEGCAVRCPWHASRFSLRDGSVLEGPATHPEAVFETRETGGRIEIRARES
jgi:nitrite reductase/ring-hydroxylating ferredoxin subunit/uncharacterized membrane protein